MPIFLSSVWGSMGADQHCFRYIPPDPGGDPGRSCAHFYRDALLRLWRCAGTGTLTEDKLLTFVVYIYMYECMKVASYIDLQCFDPLGHVDLQAVWALGNIAGDSTECRDFVIDCNILPSLVRWVAMQCCRYSPQLLSWHLSSLTASFTGCWRNRTASPWWGTQCGLFQTCAEGRTRLQISPR